MGHGQWANSNKILLTPFIYDNFPHTYMFHHGSKKIYLTFPTRLTGTLWRASHDSSKSCKKSVMDVKIQKAGPLVSMF